MVAFSVLPVFFSKPGFIRSTGQRIPPGATSVTSSARAACAPSTAAARIADEISFFMGRVYSRKSQIPRSKSQIPKAGYLGIWGLGFGVWDLGFGIWDLI